MVISEFAGLTFEEVARRWMNVTAHALKPSSARRREKCIRFIAPFSRGPTIRNVQRQYCEKWLIERGVKKAPMTINRELELMRAVFNYAAKLGLILKNPTKDIQRRRLVQAKIHIPTREQFRNLIAAICQSDGREDSQRKAKNGADLVELLAYSGCRLSEATALHWSDVDLRKAP